MILNPIENLWKIIKDKMKKIKASNETDLFDKVKQIWQTLSIDILKKLVESMPHRIQAVIEAKGGHTKY